MERSIELKGGPYDGKIAKYSGDEPIQGDDMILPSESGKQWSHYVYAVEQDKYVFRKLHTTAEVRRMFQTDSKCEGK